MEIKEIKANLSLKKVLEHYHLIPNRSKLIHCPFHQDKKPSMQINEDYYYCHGCGKKGDQIDWIENFEKITKKEAIEKCKMILGVNPKHPNNQKQQKLMKQDNLEELFKVFQENFQKTPKAIDYAKSRNLNPAEIGYNDGKLYSKLKYCLIFPLKNKTGEIVSFYGRSINETNQSKHFYTTNRQGLYPNYPKPQTQKLILTEAIIDTRTLLQIEAITKDYEVLSCYGVNGLTQEHIEAIQKLTQLEELIFFFDGDEPGENAITKYSQELTIHNPNLKITQVPTPENEDINSLLQNYDQDTILQLLNERKQINPTSSDLPASSSQLPTQTSPFIYQTQNIKIEVLGKISSKDLSELRVTLAIYNQQKEHFPSRQNLNLYNDDQVEKVIRKIAEKLELGTTIINKAIQTLITQLEQYREEQQAQKPQKERFKVRILTDTETKQTITLLKDRNLKEILIQMLEQTGLIGEGKNALFLYNILLSHKMKKTLHAVVQGTSGSGKSHLVSGVADTMYDQNKIKRFTRVTDKSFYNYGEYDLMNTGIILEDYDGLSEEAELAWRELQSNNKLSSSVSQKNEQTGDIKTGEKYVYGPIASLVATTKFRMYEDNESRVFIIAIDESEAQTQRVLDYMAKKASGEITQEQEAQTKQKLQNICYLLQPYPVKNAYRLELPNNVKHRRRLTQMLHDFIAQITILYQYQRRRACAGNDDEQVYLITEIEDLETAVDLMFNSIIIKADELDGILRQFYENLKKYIEKKAKTINKRPQDIDFTQREIRQHFNVSKTQMQRYFDELEQLEYLTRTHIGKRNSFHYQVDYWDNIHKIRQEIKTQLMDQIEQFKNPNQSRQGS